MNNEMKRCAKCGGKGEVLFSKKRGNIFKYWGECRDCLNMMKERHDDEWAAIKAWNEKQFAAELVKEGANA